MSRMSRFLFSALALACAAIPARANDAPSHLDRVPTDADLVVSARVAKLWKSDLFKSYREMLGGNEDSVAEMFGFRPSDLDRVTVAVSGDDFLAFLTTIKPTDQKFVRKEYAPRGVEIKIGDTTCYRNEERWITLAFPDAHTTLVGPSHAVELYLRRGHKKDGPQARALGAAATHDLVIGVTNGGSGFPAIEKALPEVLAAVKPLLKASQGTVVIDYRPGNPDAGANPKLEMQGTFTYADGKARRVAADALKEGWDASRKELGRLKEVWEKDGPPFTEQLNPGVLAAVKALHGAKFEVEGQDKKIAPEPQHHELCFLAEVPKPTDVGTLALGAAFQTMVRSFSSDGSPPKPDANLEKVTRALLQYAKDNDGLPPAAIYAKDGKTPLLSWRVRILPYLGDEAKKLHSQFKLDEPWDSDHNIRLVTKMPKVFAPVADEEFATAVTPFQVLTGPDTLFPGPKPKALKDATDGLANTILIAQATRPVPWTKPQDLAYDANKPVPLIGANTHLCLSGPTAQVAFADGKVRVLLTPLKVGRDPNAEIEEWADGFDHAALRGLITPAGGEKVTPDTPLEKPSAKKPLVIPATLPLELPGTPPAGPPAAQVPPVQAAPAKKLTLEDVVALSKGEASDAAILTQLRLTGTEFTLTDEQFRHLKQSGVSNAVIAGMQRALQPEKPAKPKPVVKNPPTILGGPPAVAPTGGPEPPLSPDIKPSAKEEALTELVGLSKSGTLSDAELLQVWRATGSDFALTESDFRYLKASGISDTVIAKMRKVTAPVPQEPVGAKEPPGPGGVVRAFYENLSSGKNPDKVLALFLSPDTPATGVSGGAGRDAISTKSAREFVALATEAAPYGVDSLTVTTLGDSLASVAVNFHTPAVNCKAVFTLTREGGDWRIAAYVWETRLPEPVRAPKVAPVVPAGGSAVPPPQPAPALPPLPVPPANGLAPSLPPPPARTVPSVPAPAAPGACNSPPAGTWVQVWVPGSDGKLAPTWQYQMWENRTREYHPGPVVPPADVVPHYLLDPGPIDRVGRVALPVEIPKPQPESGGTRDSGEKRLPLEGTWQLWERSK